MKASTKAKRQLNLNKIKMPRFEPRDGEAALTGYFDGAYDWETERGGWGCVLYRGSKRVAEASGHLSRGTTMNSTELTGLIECLKLAARFPGEKCEIFGDSMLTVNVVTGRWYVKQEHLKPLVLEASQLLGALDCLRLEWIPRENNTAADELSLDGLHAEEPNLNWIE